VLYTPCQRVLRPGGVLAVITASTPRPRGLRDDPGEVISRRGGTRRADAHLAVLFIHERSYLAYIGPRGAGRERRHGVGAGQKRRSQPAGAEGIAPGGLFQ
jgi:hypothetical protein